MTTPDHEKDFSERVAGMSKEAVLALLRGSNAHCPGCAFDLSIPKRTERRQAVHELGGKTYECHANSESWHDVPEFEAPENAHG